MLALDTYFYFVTPIGKNNWCLDFHSCHLVNRVEQGYAGNTNMNIVLPSASRTAFTRSAAFSSSILV